MPLEILCQRDRIPNRTESRGRKKIAEELQRGISKLGLEGDFGKFLKTSTRCSLKQALEPEVKKKLDEFDLWDTFHITL